MDRSWINSRLFGKPHLDGVSEFMKLVSENFGADEQIFCPCRRCLNRISGHKGLVEDHLYIYGMASTYTRWIYHGEPMEDTMIENTGHQDEQIDFTADVNLNEVEEDDPNDRIPDMVRELFTSEEEGRRKKSMFAILLEEMKQELYPGAAYSRFSFVVKLLHIKSFYRISNVAFTAFVKLLAEHSHIALFLHLTRKQRNLFMLWDLDIIQSMCARITVYCFGRIMQHTMCVQYVAHQDGKIKMEGKKFLRKYCVIFH